MATLSVCIISKNEEKNISRCIGSIEHIADEIIVVDTGSVDYTKTLAKSLGAKVFEHKFNNDFSSCRNESIKYASCDYILYIDCDEMIDFDGAIKLKEMISSNTNYIAYCLNLVNIINNKKCLSCSTLRVIKNHEGFKFEGRIHEQIWPSIKKKYKEEDVFISDIDLYHYGYDDNFSNISLKQNRNFKIFNSYTEEEKNGFYYFNLANEYLRLKDNKNAIKNYLKSCDYSDNENGYKVYIPIYIVKCYYDLSEFDNAIRYGEKFFEYYKTYKDLAFLLGACYEKKQDYSKAKEYLIKYIELSQRNYGYPEFNFQTDNNIEELIKNLDNLISIK